MTHGLRDLCGRAWRLLRQVSGDDAYERYLEHWRTHPHRGTPLDRQAFHAAAVQRRWSGVKRCC